LKRVYTEKSCTMEEAVSAMIFVDKLFIIGYRQQYIMNAREKDPASLVKRKERPLHGDV
jgi:hypothetical protein